MINKILVKQSETINYVSDGRTFRVLNVIDDYNRECLISKGSVSYPAVRVVRELERMIDYYGKPLFIRTDNGPEFRSDEYKEWCKKNEIINVYSEPGKPMQNGYIERFNRTFREDILDAYLFTSISQFNVIADKWAYDYNDSHPHGSLEKKSSWEFGKRTHNAEGLIPQHCD